MTERCECGRRLWWGYVPTTTPTGRPAFSDSTFCPECGPEAILRSERPPDCDCSATFVCDYCREYGLAVGVDETARESELHSLMHVRSEGGRSQ